MRAQTAQKCISETGLDAEPERIQVSTILGVRSGPCAQFRASNCEDPGPLPRSQLLTCGKSTQASAPPAFEVVLYVIAARPSRYVPSRGGEAGL